ncbi:MAG: hypothetical protein ABR540_13720 [Acidimicrobiales bacterium]
MTNTVEGRIVGGGIINGTAEGSFSFTSVDPEAGAATFEGSYLIITKHGTLSLQLFDGFIDLATLSGTNDSVVTGGRGASREPQEGSSSREAWNRTAVSPTT